MRLLRKDILLLFQNGAPNRKKKNKKRDNVDDTEQVTTEKDSSNHEEFEGKADNSSGSSLVWVDFMGSEMLRLDAWQSLKLKKKISPDIYIFELPTIETLISSRWWNMVSNKVKQTYKMSPAILVLIWQFQISFTFHSWNLDCFWPLAGHYFIEPWADITLLIINIMV